jgi:hypothetical protein
MPPRPELSDVLGIKYRRVPVLSIGRDVYCDTSLISTELERRFPESQGFATLFPARRGSSNSKDTGLIKAFVSSYTDRTLFSLAAMLLPWDQLPDAFIKDRSAVSLNQALHTCNDISLVNDSSVALPLTLSALSRCSLQSRALWHPILQALSLPSCAVADKKRRI